MGEARVLLPAPFARVLYFTARTLGVSHWQDRERICAQGHGLSRKRPRVLPGKRTEPRCASRCSPVRSRSGSEGWAVSRPALGVCSVISFVITHDAADNTTSRALRKHVLPLLVQKTQCPDLTLTPESQVGKCNEGCKVKPLPLCYPSFTTLGKLQHTTVCPHREAYLTKQIPCLPCVALQTALCNDQCMTV